MNVDILRVELFEANERIKSFESELAQLREDHEGIKTNFQQCIEENELLKAEVERLKEQIERFKNPIKDAPF